jgi:hypothetical protein
MRMSAALSSPVAADPFEDSAKVANVDGFFFALTLNYLTQKQISISKIPSLIRNPISTGFF